MVIIGICGRAGAGKDTIADYICNKHQTFKKYAFATHLKNSLKVLFNLTDEQLHDSTLKEVDVNITPDLVTSPRFLMQWTGCQLRKLSEDFFVQMLDNKIKSDQQQDVVISDIRFKNEMDYVINNNGIIIKVIRDSTTTNLANDSSETSVDGLWGDNVYLINNNDTMEELFKKVDRVFVLMKDRKTRL